MRKVRRSIRSKQVKVIKACEVLNPVLLLNQKKVVQPLKAQSILMLNKRSIRIIGPIQHVIGLILDKCLKYTTLKTIKVSLSILNPITIK
jgi:hypothetical protein